MINVKGNLWIPSDGYKYITNGSVYTDSIYLGAMDNIDNWHDTNDEPPEPEPEIGPDEDLALVRYSNELTGASDIALTEATETLIKKVMEEK